MCLKRPQRNLNVQLSERKGTLTHTVSDCELAQGCTLHRAGLWAEGCTLHRVELWAQRDTAVSFRAQPPPLYSPPFHQGSHLHALSVPALRCPKSNSCILHLRSLTSAKGTVSQILASENWFTNRYDSTLVVFYIYLCEGLQSGYDTVNYAVFLYNSEAGGALCGWCK